MLTRILSFLPHHKIRCHSTLGAMSNRLSQERSPYLLQHAQNPVHWFPWGEEAFQEARGKDKPIFLSVGYSTCHWCHVMERESFENEDVAAIMNEHFVNVKVDREERPDVDKVYMAFVQATTGGGGWPMSVFLTPTLKPFFGGTYFPPEDRYGRPGFKSLLRSIAGQWRENREAIVESGDAIIEVMTESEKSSGESDASLPSAEDSMAKCFAQLLKRYDPEFGGFSAAPKFPSPVNFNFLFRLYAHDPSSDRSKQALRMCLHSLEMMALGGINDHISQGFARYSTDAKWHVPHFEKMLYDQSQLAVSYSQAYQASKDEKFSRVVEDIMTYVLRDLRHPMGGFFSAEDADSLPTAESEHKREGAFCVWTHDDVHRILPDKIASGSSSMADLLCAYYHVEEGGNVDPRGDPHGELKGQNVLTRLPVVADEELVKRFGLSDKKQLKELLSEGRRRLFEERSKRPRPHLDDKILVSWNGLMLSGCCAAASALQRQAYVDTATKAALFIKEHLYLAETRVLLHSIYTKSSDRDQVEQIAKPIEGFADDYAYLVRGLLDLYEVTFDSSWLEWACELQDKQDALFWDTEASGYFMSAAGDPSIVLRLKEDQDGVEPATNSVAASNLLRLSSLLGRSEYRARAEQVLSAGGERLSKIPMAVPELVTALVWAQEPHTQIIVTGSPETSSVTKQMVGLVQSNLVPNRILIVADGKKDSFLRKSLKVMSDIPADKPGLAYVCKNNTCARPVDSVAELANSLKIKAHE